MLTHPTHERLITLGLTGMAKALQEQRRSPDLDAMSFEERVGLLVDREAAERIAGARDLAFKQGESAESFTLAMALAGCGLKGALTLPQKSTNVVVACTLAPSLKINVLGAVLIVLFGFLFVTVSFKICPNGPNKGSDPPDCIAEINIGQAKAGAAIANTAV